jgi:hypothetical protein
MEPNGNGRPRLRLDPTIRVDLLALIVMAASLVWMGAGMRNDIDHHTRTLAELGTAVRSLVAVDARLAVLERNLDRLADRVEACERRIGAEPRRGG